MAPSVGIIGFGALGRTACDLLAGAGQARVAGVFARRALDPRDGVRGVRTLGELLASKPDVVIECAGQAALREYALDVVASGAHLVPASIGALADDAWRRELVSACKARKVELRIPSGAMVGIDGLAAARDTGLDRVLYRGTMPPHALRNFDGAAVSTRTLAFEGNARQAVARFPKNANLTGTIALAGLGFERTRVELFVDPGVKANVHELEACGAFGSFRVRVEGNRISETSPSSRIVAGSLVQAALGSGYTLLAAD